LLRVEERPLREQGRESQSSSFQRRERDPKGEGGGAKKESKLCRFEKRAFFFFMAEMRENSSSIILEEGTFVEKKYQCPNKCR